MHQQWKGELMICDIDYRYRRALEPDNLTTYDTAIHALNEAIDARLPEDRPRIVQRCSHYAASLPDRRRCEPAKIPRMQTYDGSASTSLQT